MTGTGSLITRTDEVRKQRAVELRSEGKTWTEIGKLLGVTRQGAQYLATKAKPNIGRSAKPLSTSQCAECGSPGGKPIKTLDLIELEIAADPDEPVLCDDCRERLNEQLLNALTIWAHSPMAFFERMPT